MTDLERRGVAEPPAGSLAGEALRKAAPYDREAHIASYVGSEYRAEPNPADDWFLAFWDAGYSWCRVHEEYHRLPECAIEGRTAPKEIE